MDFPRRCLQSCGRSRDHSVLEKKKHTNAELNVWGVSQRTLKISPIHEIAQLKMCLCCSIAAPAVSSACWFYVVDVGRLFFFFFLCLFVCLLLLEEKLLWLTFRGALFMKHNHYIPYPSPPATSAPDSLWTSICVWGNTMDKRSIQHRLKSSHLAAPFSKTLHRLTQSGEQRVCLRGKCRCVPRTRNRNQVISVSKLGYFLDIYMKKNSSTDLWLIVLLNVYPTFFSYCWKLKAGEHVLLTLNNIGCSRRRRLSSGLLEDASYPLKNPNSCQKSNRRMKRHRRRCINKDYNVPQTSCIAYFNNLKKMRQTSLAVYQIAFPGSRLLNNSCRADGYDSPACCFLEIICLAEWRQTLQETR